MFSETRVSQKKATEKMLRYVFSPKLLNYPRDVMFQQDDTSTYSAVHVRQYLDQKLGSR